MKKGNHLFLLIVIVLIVYSCTSPNWKQRGFQSENEYTQYIQDSIRLKELIVQDSIDFQKWLKDDGKFTSTWYDKRSGGYEPYDYEQTFTMEIMIHGFGNFVETQYSPSKGYTTYMDESSFIWEKTNDSTILIKNLEGRWDRFDGVYAFERFNGEYKVSHNSKYEIINLKTGNSFKRD